MVRRSGYGGVRNLDERFEAMREGVARLRTLELAQASPTPAAVALDHAVSSICSAANLLTSQIAFFELERRGNRPDVYERAVAELQALQPIVLDLSAMARAYHPASPESRTLMHAAAALRLAAAVVTGRSDFYQLSVGDGSTPHQRG